MKPAHNSQSNKLCNLIIRVSQGDQRALSDLLDTRRKLNLRIAFGYLKDWHKAEDALSLFSLKLYKNASAFDAKKGPPEAFLNSMLRNTLIDLQRVASSKRRPEILPTDDSLLFNFLESQDAAQNHPLLSNHQYETYHRVKQCINSLSTALRIPIERLLQTGDTYDQISEDLSMPVGTVKSNIRRGIIQIREMLCGYPRAT